MRGGSPPRLAPRGEGALGEKLLRASSGSLPLILRFGAVVAKEKIESEGRHRLGYNRIGLGLVPDRKARKDAEPVRFLDEPRPLLTGQGVVSCGLVQA